MWLINSIGVATSQQTKRLCYVTSRDELARKGWLRIRKERDTSETVNTSRFNDHHERKNITFLHRVDLSPNASKAKSFAFCFSKIIIIIIIKIHTDLSSPPFQSVPPIISALREMCKPCFAVTTVPSWSESMFINSSGTTDYGEGVSIEASRIYLSFHDYRKSS